MELHLFWDHVNIIKLRKITYFLINFRLYNYKLLRVQFFEYTCLYFSYKSCVDSQKWPESEILMTWSWSCILGEPNDLKRYWIPKLIYLLIIMYQTQTCTFLSKKTAFSIRTLIKKDLRYQKRNKKYKYKHLLFVSNQLIMWQVVPNNSF